MTYIVSGAALTTTQSVSQVKMIT